MIFTLPNFPPGNSNQKSKTDMSPGKKQVKNKWENFLGRADKRLFRLIPSKVFTNSPLESHH